MSENAHMIACRDCDLLHQIPRTSSDSRLLCRRCGAILIFTRSDTISRTLPLVASGLILFFLANGFPFMALHSSGIQQDTIFISGIFQLFQQKMWLLGSVVVVTTLLAPLLYLLGLSYILVLMSLGAKIPGGRLILKSVNALQPWNMLEIYMLGVLVALVKLLKLATVIPGIALYSFAGLILIQVAISLVMDQHQLWERLNGT